MAKTPRGDSGRIYKTWLQVGPKMSLMDTIWHEGQFWLVPNWYVRQDKSMMQPIRIISLATIPHAGPLPAKDFQFSVNAPIPKALFVDGVAPPGTEGEFVVVEEPSILFPIPDDRD